MSGAPVEAERPVRNGDGVIGGFTRDMWEVKVRGRLCLPYWIEQAQ